MQIIRVSAAGAMYAEITAPFFPQIGRPVFLPHQTNSVDVSNSVLRLLTSSYGRQREINPLSLFEDGMQAL